MTKKEIEEMYQQAKKDVSVHCDEYHVHTALDGCLSGDPHAINVCKLYEHIQELHITIKKIYRTIEDD